MDQFLTYKKANLGPVFNFTAYIYDVELKTGPRFGVSCVKNWSKWSVKSWSSFLKCFGACLKTQIVSHCAKIVFLQNFGLSKMRISKRKLHVFVIFFLCWRNRNRKKEKKEIGKGKKETIKIMFLRWSSKNVKHQRRIVSKNCLTLFVSGREKNAHFRAHYLF